MQGNDVFEMFPEFSNVVHIFAAIPATSYSAERSYSASDRLKPYLLLIMGQEAHMIDSLERIFSLIRWPMSVHRMTLVPIWLFRKHLGNLREFFGQMARRPPWQKTARTPMARFETHYLTAYNLFASEPRPPADRICLKFKIATTIWPKERRSFFQMIEEHQT